MGDYIRWSPPFHEGADDSAKSALFLSLNRGKRSIRLNLKEEAGQARFCCGWCASTTCCSSPSARA